MGDKKRDKLNQSIDMLKNAANLQTWTTVKGNSYELEYYTGIETGNPSGDKNIKRIKYKQGEQTVLYKELTYDADNDVLTVSAH
jgi:hypothetical protein